MRVGRGPYPIGQQIEKVGGMGRRGRGCRSTGERVGC